MVKRILFFLSFIPVLASLANAQEGLPSFQQGTVNILYRFQIDEDFYYLGREAGVYVWDGYAGPFPAKEFWYYSIESYLSSADNIAQVFRFAADEAESADPLAEATARNLPIFVDIHLSGNINTGQATVRYSIRELFSELNVLEKSFEERIPTEDELLSYFWMPIAIDLDVFVKKTLKPLLTIAGPAGVTVRGFTEEPFVMPERGSINLYVPMPSTYRWEMSGKPYITRTGVFMADKDRAFLQLPAQKFFPTSVDISFFQGRFPEIWITRYLKSDGWFFRAGLQQQVFGFLTTKAGEPLQTSFNTRPLLMPGLAAGYHFKTGEPYIPKLFFEVSAQVRIDYVKHCFDDFSPLSVMAFLGYDWETSLHVSLFAELGAAAYILRYGHRNSVSKGTEDAGFLQVILGDAIFIELPTFNLGVKILLPF